MKTIEKNHLVNIVFAVFSAFLVMATFAILLDIAALGVNDRSVASSIKRSLLRGEVSFPSAWNRNTKTGIDTWTDCLTIRIATYDEKDIVSALAKSNRVKRNVDEHPCDQLAKNIGITASPEQTLDYWRYWWGSAALLNIFLGVLNFSLLQYQHCLKFLTYSVVAFVAVLAVWRYGRRAAPILPLVFALGFGFALPLFGQSIAHAPGLIAGLALVCFYLGGKLDRLSLTWQIALFFLIGGIVFYFELLNGDLVAVLLVLSLVNLISVSKYGLRNDVNFAFLKKWPASIWVATSACAYVAGAAAMAILRIFIRAVLMRQNFLVVLAQWQAQASRWTSGKLDGQAVTQVGKTSNSSMIKYLIDHCYYQLDVSTFPYVGRHGVVIVYILGALLYLATFAWKFKHRKLMSKNQRDYFIAGMLIVAIVPLWYAVFTAHAIVHFWMMGRLLTLFFSLSVSLALIGRMSQFRTLVEVKQK